MKRQKNTTQMKEQTRNPEVQINEEEIGKLPEKEFRIMIVKIIKNLKNKNTHPIISRQDQHLTQPCPSEEKQTNKKTQHKSHPIQSSHKPLDQSQEGRKQKQERIQPSSRKEFNFPLSLGKGDLKHSKFKKK